MTHNLRLYLLLSPRFREKAFSICFLNASSRFPTAKFSKENTTEVVGKRKSFSFHILFQEQVLDDLQNVIPLYML